MSRMMPSPFLRIVLMCMLVYFPVTRSKKYCEERLQSLISLDIAEDLITRAEYLFPNCTDSTTDISECGAEEKSLAYLKMTKKLILESKKNYPTCINPEARNSKRRDCFDILQKGQNVSGVYTIWPSSSLFPSRSLEVFCDMDTDGGGWTVVQRRGDFTPQEDFIRGWKDYKRGFGNIKKDFWLGNDNLFVLSNQGIYTIRFDIKSAKGEKAYAEYESFNIGNEKANFKLRITGYTGNAGDTMQTSNGQVFTTDDRHNGKEPFGCAAKERGWWWYVACGDSNPNGKYNPGANDCKSMYWYLWKNCVGLASTEIKIRPVQN